MTLASTLKPYKPQKVVKIEFQAKSKHFKMIRSGFKKVALKRKKAQMMPHKKSLIKPSHIVRLLRETNMRFLA